MIVFKKIALFVIILQGVSFISLAQPLDSLLELATNNNPELKAIHAEYEAILSRGDQVSQLPDPTIGTGVPVLQPETRLGPQVLMVSASQMFPWFGTLQAKEDAVVSMSKAKFEMISATKLDLFYKIKVAYYMLDFLTLKAEVLLKSKNLYQSLESIALAKVESGQALTSDVLRIQLVIQDIDQKLRVIDNTKIKFEAIINQYTNRDPGEKVNIVSELNTITAFQFDTTALGQKVRDHHPMIMNMNYQLEASDNRLIANKKMNSVKFGVGVDYNVVAPRTDANPLGNGRDILVPKIMFNVPIYRKSYKAKEQEEYYTQESIEYRKEVFTDMIMRQLIEYKVDYDNALLEFELHEKQIETTNMAIEVLLVNYSSSGKGFDELLQLQNQLLKHEIGLIKGKLDMRIAIANIERLTDF
ncbi:MAG: TolC family protein [Crocinitomicaceae bacterium]|nr:TolC family protein [Crocinitomicaceae bacterium]